MDPHEKWLRDNGFGSMLDKRPEWRENCKCDGNNMDEVCPTCVHTLDCAKFFQPLAEALERFSQIGEV